MHGKNPAVGKLSSAKRVPWLCFLKVYSKMGLEDMAKGNHILCFSKVNKQSRQRMNSILLVHVKLPHNMFYLQVTLAQ